MYLGPGMPADAWAVAAQRAQCLDEGAPVWMILIELVCKGVSADQDGDADFGRSRWVTRKANAYAARGPGDCRTDDECFFRALIGGFDAASFANQASRTLRARHAG